MDQNTMIAELEQQAIWHVNSALATGDERDATDIAESYARRIAETRAGHDERAAA